MPKLRIYFSDFFNVSPEKIKEYGAFNISLINDLPLFIDPFLGNDSNLLIVFYVQIMPDDFVMQLHRF